MATVRTLVLLRHAKSAWPEGIDDADRPLAARGKRDARAAGVWLREHVPDIGVVACSPALRTLQTWRLATAELHVSPTLQVESKIYAASVRDLMAVVHALPADVRTAMLIGHNPAISELVGVATGTRWELKTSAIAVLRGAGEWADAGQRWADLDRTAKPRG
jgi:phosphohistidine phosphatase